MTNLYKARIDKIKKQFKNKSSALLISSAPLARRSHDTNHPFRQDSSFFYLTGCLDKDLSILIDSNSKNGFLLTTPIDKNKVVWDGAPSDHKALAKQLGLELVVSSDLKKEVITRLKNIETLYHQNSANTLSWRITREIIESPSFTRSNLPKFFAHADVLLEHMRLFKEPAELSFINHAIEITHDALVEAAGSLSHFETESDVASALDYVFKFNDCQVAFNTIVACGASAATLHYEDGHKALESSKMLQIDCGAEFQLYAADISRVFPLSGKFDPVQSQIYKIVLSAQKAAISKVKAGVSLKTVYDAATKELTIGLVDLGVLKGKVANLISKQAYKPYFMHGIGHSLGLDVHDIGNLRSDQSSVLEEGMVITIEPGLYFSKKVGKILPCGIRIEDDVLVKKNGCVVLSEQIPKEMRQVEAMVG